MKSILPLIVVCVALPAAVQGLRGQAFSHAEPPPAPSLVTKDARPEAIAVGFSFSLLSYSGDVDENLTFPDGQSAWLPGAGVMLQARAFKIGSSFAAAIFRLGAEYVPMKGKSSVYEFMTHSLSSTFHLKLEFATSSHIRPHITGGIGFLYFESTVTPYGEEWQRRWEVSRGKSNTAFIFPLGIGVTWTVGKKFDVYYQFLKTLTFSDNLDGWESNINDNYQGVDVGVLFFL